jgi:regulator of sirC expression with transglutaminase-like and TPR domain
MNAALRHAWAHTVGGDVADDDLDLAACALLIAEIERPGLEVAATLARLDALAEGARPRPGETGFSALRRHLFDELGLRGNVAAYEDPRNSCLDQVLERRLGIPITLALVMMEVGRRAGVELEGVGFPGHFLVRAGARFYDPFGGGVELDRPALESLLRQRHPGATLTEQHLRTASRREILGRMLNNLHRIYRRAGDAAHLAEVEGLLGVLGAALRGRRSAPN